MKSLVEEYFYENEEILNSSFNYEKFGNQLHMLGYGADQFTVKPSPSIQKKARLFFDKLISQSTVDKSLCDTLLYVQARELINTYVKQASLVSHSSLH